jgi:drug/metabolite transporter (DMT)-like permease
MKQTKSFVLVLLPILIWSSVAVLVNTGSSEIDPLGIPLIGIVSATLAAFSFNLTSQEITKRKLHTINDFFLGKQKYYIRTVVTGFFITTHYFSLYYLLSSEYVVQANIINYLWPLFLFLLMKPSVYNGERNIRLSEVMFMLMAFLGSLVLITGGYFSINNLVIIENWIFPTLGILSAVSAAVYMRLGKVINSEFIPIRHNLFFASIFSILFFSMFSSFDSLQASHFIYGMPIGFISIFMANHMWLSALAITQRSSITSVAYFVPVFSTGLILLFLDLPLNSNIIIGLFLVVLANLFLHSGKIIRNKINMLLLSFSFIGTLLWLIDPSLNTKAEQLIGPLSTTFALLAAFLLNRAWEKRTKEGILYRKLEKILIDDKLGQKPLDCMCMFYTIDSLRAHVGYVKLKRCIDYCIRSTDSILPEKHLKKIDTFLSTWLFLKESSVSSSEKLILVLLGILIVGVSIFTRSPDIISDLATAIFGATIMFIMYLVIEFDRSWITLLPNKPPKLDNVAHVEELIKSDNNKILYTLTKLYNIKWLPLVASFTVSLMFSVVLYALLERRGFIVF